MHTIPFIALSGVDGSGKSTQLEPLMEHLVKNGHKVAYFHAVEFSLANRINRFLHKEKVFEAGKEKAVTESSLVSLILREKFLFIDFIRFQFWRRHLRLEGYDYILSDRSFYDSLINIEFLNLTKGSPLVRLGVWFLSRIIPRATQVFFFELKAADIMTRSRVPEQGAQYLESKLKLFEQKKQLWNLITINATQSEDVIRSALIKAIEQSQ
jgi:thymidylate kinase